MTAPCNRNSLIEYSPRERLGHLLDDGSARELLGPFEQLTSPWLARQGIVTQSDDGVVLMQGKTNGQPVIGIAIDGDFQGGSLGEVGGAKIASALELAIEDNRRGIATAALLLLETGGVRLQEANLGLAAIGDIHSAIVRLRRLAPVVGVITGPVGCYGGMSIAAGLCSTLIMTREARLGLNGPAVIEQEAGINELDSRNKPLIWSITGGEQRCNSGLADIFSADDVEVLRNHVATALMKGIPAVHRSDAIEPGLALLRKLAATPDQAPVTTSPLHTAPQAPGRGRAWLAALADGDPVHATAFPSVQFCDVQLQGHNCRLVAVVPDPDSPFPRARHGEVGLAEGWGLAKLIDDTVNADRHHPEKRALVAVIDVPSQAYGRLEETHGLHQALAAAVSAWIRARMAGHRVIGLIVGQAMSGAYLAHGYQAHRLIALDDPGVQLHAMGKASAARVTQRSIQALDELAGKIPPMGYDIAHYQELGLLWRTFRVNHADQPDRADAGHARQMLLDALTTPLVKDQEMLDRPGAPLRQATETVRERLRQQWLDHA